MKKREADKIKWEKRQLENYIKDGQGIWFIDNQIEEIKKLYARVEKLSKKDKQDQMNFIYQYNSIIERARENRINYLNYYLYNEVTIDTKEDIIRGLKQELNELETITA